MSREPEPATVLEAYTRLLDDITRLLWAAGLDRESAVASGRKKAARTAATRYATLEVVGDLVLPRLTAQIDALAPEPAEPVEPAVAELVEEPMRPGAVILLTYYDVIAPLQRTSCPDAGCATHHERPWVGVGGLQRFTWADITAPPVSTITVVHPGIDR
jgi:hypothetical protein